MNRSFVAALLFSIAVSAPAWSVPKLCATANGDLITRPRCKANETVMNKTNLRALLQVPSDIAACRQINVVGDSPATVSNYGQAMGRADCASNEFLLNYGYYTVPTVLDFNRVAKMVYTGNIPTGVIVAVGVELETPDDPFFMQYQLHVTATCCPHA
jgi:hypothetical protein